MKYNDCQNFWDSSVLGSDLQKWWWRCWESPWSCLQRLITSFSLEQKTVELFGEINDTQRNNNLCKIWRSYVFLHFFIHAPNITSQRWPRRTAPADCGVVAKLEGLEWEPFSGGTLPCYSPESGHPTPNQSEPRQTRQTPELRFCFPTL